MRYSEIIILFVALNFSILSEELWARGAEDLNYVSLGFHNPSIDLVINNEGSANENTVAIQELHYQPATPVILSLGISYKGFGGSLSQDVATESDAKSLDYTDYRLNYFADYWGIDGQYSEFLRFKLDHANGVDASTLPESDTERMDMAVTFASGNIYLFPLALNWRLDPAMDPAREDKTNGIALGVIGNYSSLGVDTVRGIVPSSFQSQFGKEGDIKRGSFRTAQAEFALGTTLTLAGLYVSALAAVGQGEQTLSYETSEGTQNKRGHAVTSILHVVSGFVGKTFFVNAEYRVDSPTYIMQTVSLSTERSEISLKAGAKF